MTDDGGDRDARRLIRTHLLDALRSHGAATCHRLARELTVTRQRVDALLRSLIQDHTARALTVDGMTYYVVPSPEFEACACDGTGVKQASILSRRPIHRLWSWLQRNSPCDSVRLLARARESGWSRSTLYNRLGILQQVGLVARIPSPFGDRRLGWYEAKAPLPSARALLQHRLQEVGQTDEDSSTPEDSSRLGHR